MLDLPDTLNINMFTKINQLSLQSPSPAQKFTQQKFVRTSTFKKRRDIQLT